MEVLATRWCYKETIIFVTRINTFSAVCFTVASQWRRGTYSFPPAVLPFVLLSGKIHCFVFFYTCFCIKVLFKVWCDVIFYWKENKASVLMKWRIDRGLLAHLLFPHHRNKRLSCRFHFPSLFVCNVLRFLQPLNPETFIRGNILKGNDKQKLSGGFIHILVPFNVSGRLVKQHFDAVVMTQNRNLQHLHHLCLPLFTSFSDSDRRTRSEWNCKIPHHR